MEQITYIIKTQKKGKDIWHYFECLDFSIWSLEEILAELAQCKELWPEDRWKLVKVTKTVVEEDVII